MSDFGEAKWLPGLVDGNEYLKSMRGTSRYMAPEVVRRQYNAGADVYSIGCTVLEMLTGAQERSKEKKHLVMLFVLGLSFINEAMYVYIHICMCVCVRKRHGRHARFV